MGKTKSKEYKKALTNLHKNLLRTEISEACNGMLNKEELYKIIKLNPFKNYTIKFCKSPQEFNKECTLRYERITNTYSGELIEETGRVLLGNVIFGESINIKDMQNKDIYYKENSTICSKFTLDNNAAILKEIHYNYNYNDCRLQNHQHLIVVYIPIDHGVDTYDYDLEGVMTLDSAKKFFSNEVLETLGLTTAHMTKKELKRYLKKIFLTCITGI